MTLHLTGVWLLLVTHTVLVFCDVEFLDRQQGDSVEFPCISEFKDAEPIGLYLKRKWLQPNREVLFMYTDQNPVAYPDVNQRIHVTGDLSTHRVNVTLRQLKGTDTDLYYCEFVFPNTSFDTKIPSKMEFFLYVDDAEDAPDNKMDVGLIETCAGGSAVLPCLAPYGSPSAMEGVCLKRRWGRTPVEVLFHSKRPSSSSALFPTEERLHLGTGLGSLAYNLTLLEMQPEESAFYSCELLLPGRSDNSARLGRHVYFVSVQGVSCSCTSYAPLLYILSAAVGLLLIVLMTLGLAYAKTRGDRVKPLPQQAGIYEEMFGVRPPNGNKKVSPSYHVRPPLHLEEMDASAYDNPPLRSRQENHYEKPEGAPLVSETAGEM